MSIIFMQTKDATTKAVDPSNYRFKLLAHLLDRLSDYFSIAQIKTSGEYKRESFVIMLSDKSLASCDRYVTLETSGDKTHNYIKFRQQKYLVSDHLDIDTIFPSGQSAEERTNVAEPKWAERICQQLLNRQPSSTFPNA
jgi:hypothetical protein